MIKLKPVIKKTFTWLKKNWFYIAIVVVVVLFSMKFISSDKSYKNLYKNFTQQNADTQQQILELRSLQDKERQERNRMQQEYLAEIQRIELEYKAGLEQIVSDRNNEQDNIIANHATDPSSLTSEFSTVFGIPIDR